MALICFKITTLIIKIKIFFGRVDALTFRFNIICIMRSNYLKDMFILTFFLNQVCPNIRDNFKSLMSPKKETFVNAGRETRL